MAKGVPISHVTVLNVRMAETSRLEDGILSSHPNITVSDVTTMKVDLLLAICDELNITPDADEEPDVDSYRSALLKYIANRKKTSPTQELPLAQATARFKERHLQQKSGVLSIITLIEQFVNGADVKGLLSKLDIQTKKQWITEEEFARMRKEISETVPVLLVLGSVSSGKSSLLNAILGEEILPKSHNADTAVMCELKYSRKDGKKMAVAYFKEGSEELDLEDENDRKKFKMYVTKQGDYRKSTSHTLESQPSPSSSSSPSSFSAATAAAAAADVEEEAEAEPDKIISCYKVEIRWPSEFLKDFVLMDSPGIIDENDLSALMTIKRQCLTLMPCGFIFVLDAIKSAQEAAKAWGLLRYILKVTDRIPAPGSALFVANKWDLVVSDQATDKSKIWKELLANLAKEWRGFQQHQLITMASLRSGDAFRAGSVCHDIVQLCEGIQNVLTEGSDHIFLTVVRSCLDLIALIADQVEQTVCSINMPQEMRMRKRNDDGKKIEKLQYDYNHGQLGKQRKELTSKIQETAVALEEQLTSKSHRQAIKKKATLQSDHEGIFAALEDDKDRRGALQFANERLLNDIASAQKYMEVSQWAKDKLMVEMACFNANIPLAAIERSYSECRRVTLPEQDTEEHSNTGFLWFHTAFLALVNLPGALLCVPAFFEYQRKGTMDAFCTAVKFVPSFHIDNWRDKTSFVSSVVDTYTATVNQLVKNNREGLCNLLQQFLINDVRSARILMHHVPEHIETLKSKLKSQASLEQKDNCHFQSMFHDVTKIWNKLATAVQDLKVHTWSSESVDIPPLADENDATLASGSFRDAFIKTGDTTMKATIMLINVKTDESLLKEIALAVAMPRVQLEHENIVQVFGSVLLDPDAMKIGLLFEQCANQPVTDELFEAERKLKIERASQLALDVSHAICYLHDNDIVLRGFSSDNVKKADNGTVKLFPPPYGKQLWHSTSCLDGYFHDDLAYAAPEVLYHWLCDEKADIYSIGILLSEIWAGHCAYIESRETLQAAAEFAEGIKAAKLRPSKLFQKTTGDPLVGHEDAIESMRRRWHNLAVGCWKSEPSARPKAEDVRQQLHAAATQSHQI